MLWDHSWWAREDHMDCWGWLCLILYLYPPQGPSWETVLPSRGAYLCTGRSHSAPGHLDVEAPLGVFLPSQARVIGGLSAALPVTDGFPNGLQDTVGRRVKLRTGSATRTDQDCLESPEDSQACGLGGLGNTLVPQPLSWMGWDNPCGGQPETVWNQCPGPRDCGSAAFLLAFRSSLPGR